MGTFVLQVRVGLDPCCPEGESRDAEPGSQDTKWLFETGFEGFSEHDAVGPWELMLSFGEATEQGLYACSFGEIIVLEGFPMQYLVVNSPVGDYCRSDVFYDLGYPARPGEFTGVECFPGDVPALLVALHHMTKGCAKYEMGEKKGITKAHNVCSCSYSTEALQKAWRLMVPSNVVFTSTSTTILYMISS
jgi:hypothetical protein